LPIVLALAGCSSLKSISISPPSGTVLLTAIGQTAQFTALGASQMGSANSTTSNITDSVTWSVSNPSVATINANGLATAVGAGYTQVLAESGGITATSDLTVELPATTGGTTSSSVTSLSVIPGTQEVATPAQTTQFIAIGTTSSGTTLNLTNQVQWSSSSLQIATVGASSGLATAVGQGTATITALYANASTGTVVPGTASFTVAGGTPEKYTAVSITPNSQAVSASGQTGQFLALATSGTSGLQTDVTASSQIKWSSSIPTVATVGASSGLVTGVSAGSSTITAELTNTDGTVVSNTATITVTSTAAPEPLLSLTIVPPAITVGNLQDTGQFLAIGTYSTAPYVRDLTNSSNLNWITSAPNVFPVNTNTAGTPGALAGTVTAYGTGTAEIIAEAVNPSDGTIQTATASFSCPLVLPTPTTAGSCYPGSQSAGLLATLTVYNEGLNTTNWLVTAPSATGTPSVLHCGPGSPSGGSVCVASYPVGTTVTLTAPANGASFGGWSYNCTQTVPAPPAAPSASGPNACSVTLTTNDTVGAIFN
jgi:predicted secreted protein